MSQQDGVTKIIGEHEYTMYMLPPMLSNDLLIDVLKMSGPSIGKGLDAILGSDNVDVSNFNLEDLEIPKDFFTDVIGGFLQSLEKEVFNNVMNTFKKVTLVKDVGQLDGAGVFDVHFMGELDKMYKWVAFGISVQWGKSLSALIEGGSSLIPRQQNKSVLKSQST